MSWVAPANPIAPTWGRDCIESHLPDHFTLRDIGQAAAMSVFHYHRSFVEVFGETPHEYTTRRRLALARDLLASTDLTIGDSSFAAGFGSPTSFSAAFRRHEAHSPTAFRQARRGSRFPGRDRRVACPGRSTGSCHPRRPLAHESDVLVRGLCV
jgi:AraC-like DNA-binding protein